jgi:hypothetical protein
MRELTDRKWILAKGVLFLFLGVLALALLYSSQPTLRTALLLAIAIWAFCRFYYFAFYVVEHYVDQEYRFSGLLSLVRHYLRRGSETVKSCHTLN